MNLIAITTKDRPQTLALCLSQIFKYKQPDEVVYVYDDGSTPENAKRNKTVTYLTHLGFKYEYHENKGIAYSKNKCLEYAKKINADNVILLDDDCFPIKENYFQYLTEISKKYNEHYFTLVDGCDPTTKEQNKIYNFVDTDEIKAFAKTYGVMQFITKKVLDENIKFNTEFKRYGSEHILFMLEVANKGLSRLGVNLQPTDLKEYFHSIDLHGNFNGIEIKEESMEKQKKDYYSAQNSEKLIKFVKKLDNLNFNSLLKK